VQYIDMAKYNIVQALVWHSPLFWRVLCSRVSAWRALVLHG